jgi:hypothetical protein
MAKKKCSKKCNQKKCMPKEAAQKKCDNQLPSLDSQDIVLQPKSKTCYFYQLIKKAFGYE